MTKERMNELLLLTVFINYVDSDTYNVHEMESRYSELKDEFLRPYVINSNSKE